MFYGLPVQEFSKFSRGAQLPLTFIGVEVPFSGVSIIRHSNLIWGKNISIVVLHQLFKMIRILFESQIAMRCKKMAGLTTTNIQDRIRSTAQFDKIQSICCDMSWSYPFIEERYPSLCMNSKYTFSLLVNIRCFVLPNILCP